MSVITHLKLYKLIQIAIKISNINKVIKLYIQVSCQ